MPNTFPIFLSFTNFAPIILRIPLGILFCSLFIKLAIKSFKKENQSSKIQKAEYILGTLCGIAVFVGIFTQIASLLGIVIILKELISKTKIFGDTKTHVLLMSMFLTLFILGAGFFAFDLPF